MDNQDTSFAAQELRTVSGKIVKLMRDSYNYAQSDPEASMNKARQVAESICLYTIKKHRLTKTLPKDLQSMMQILNHNPDIMPVKIHSNVEILRRWGNMGSHYSDEVLEPEDIGVALNAMSTLSNWFFTQNNINRKELPSYPEQRDARERMEHCNRAECDLSGQRNDAEDRMNTKDLNDKNERKRNPYMLAVIIVICLLLGVGVMYLYRSGRMVPVSIDVPDKVNYGIENTPMVSLNPAVPRKETTEKPAALLTAEPTPAPTAEPTPAPTAEPTPVPTAEPTPVPTAEPTPVPTAEPTPVPTAEPTPAPTAEPTPAPTAAPTPSAVPVQLRGYDRSANEYKYLHFGRYTQRRGNQSILWRVLTVIDGEALLLSEYILDTRSFDARTTKWENSSIKTWLNGAFYDLAFTEDERKAICPNGEIGEVFLLSYSDLTREEYGFSSREHTKDVNRAARGTAHALDAGLYLNVDNGGSSYYTRSGQKNKTVDMVQSNGMIGSAKIDRDNVGIRPAIWVNIEAMQLTEGEGTTENPYR